MRYYFTNKEWNLTARIPWQELIWISDKQLIWFEGPCFRNVPFTKLMRCAQSSFVRHASKIFAELQCVLLTGLFSPPPAVNGYLFGNLPGLAMCNDDKVSWHLIALGTHSDMHGVHFQGNTIHLKGTTRDSLTLFPHSSWTALMQADHVGMFLSSSLYCFLCRVQKAWVAHAGTSLYTVLLLWRGFKVVWM